MGETAGVAISVNDLIGELNYSSEGRGEEAKFELTSRGVEVVPELAARVVDLERLGKLLAIEAFETLGDPRACSGPGPRAADKPRATSPPRLRS
jgi:hypothetical protein